MHECTYLTAVSTIVATSRSAQDLAPSQDFTIVVTISVAAIAGVSLLLGATITTALCIVVYWKKQTAQSRYDRDHPKVNCMLAPPNQCNM